ncbi:MAG: hypothetical protein WBB85_12015 [Albidovulum sp.]|uniref:hypothetical protein n=1 Tax=Albidovulum sp. TaxID=1872424 RepID=UPI003CA6DC60
MSDTQRVDVAKALTGILSQGRIPDNLRPSAEALISRLTKPVRVTVFGFPGSGKSSLVNLLLGSQVLKADDRLPTTQFTWGEEPNTRCTMADGSTSVFPHVNTAEIAAQAPIFVKAELPLPALGKISVMEVVAQTAEDVRRALHWASSRTDIAIWCSQKFNSAEQALWGTATDDMKDHGFLAVTKADELVAQGVLDATLANLQERGAEEFNRVLPIATLDAIAARREDGSIDKDQLTRSGGRALIAAILREVDLGHQAARDQADILLQQFGDGAAVTDEAPKVDAAVNPMPEPEALPEIEVEAAPAEASDLEEAAELSEVEATPEPSGSQDAGVAGLSPVARSAYQEAIRRLSRHGRDAAEAMKASGALDTVQLVDDTVESVQWLSDYLGEKTGDDATIERMRDAAFDAADLLQLMQMENDTNSVKESISIAIQLKREMEAALAA